MLPAVTDSDGQSESLSLVRHVLLRAGPPSQLAIIAAAVPATQALSHAGGTRPAGPIDSESVCPPSLSARLGSVCLYVPESPNRRRHTTVCHGGLSGLGVTTSPGLPAGPRPETRPAGYYKPKGVIQRLSGGSESAALASPVKFSVRPSNRLIETPSR